MPPDSAAAAAGDAERVGVASVGVAAGGCATGGAVSAGGSVAAVGAVSAVGFVSAGVGDVVVGTGLDEAAAEVERLAAVSGGASVRPGSRDKVGPAVGVRVAAVPAPGSPGDGRSMGSDDPRSEGRVEGPPSPTPQAVSPKTAIAASPTRTVAAAARRR
jgi:hypothetical protein